MNTNTTRIMALAGLATVILPLSAQAQESDGWEWRATIYGWLPDIEMTTRYPTGEGGPSIEIDTEDIINNLDFTFMGALHAHKGAWGIFTDVTYLDAGDGKSATRDFNLGPNGGIPGNVTVDARIDIKSWLWTVGGSYALSQSETHLVDFTFGARMMDMTQDLDWHFSGDIDGTPLPGREGSSKVSGTNWDAVVGLKGYNFLGADGRWVVPWLADIGTGDSDLVWQAMAGTGYHFSWGEVLLTYRYLDYDNDDDQPVDGLTISGPMIAASFAW